MTCADAIFQGDDDCMVDRLIEACKSSKSASPIRPELIGRELVAVDCAWLDVPLPAHVAAQYQRHSSNGGGGQPRTSMSAPGSPSRSGGKCPTASSFSPKPTADAATSPAPSTAPAHTTKKPNVRANSAKPSTAVNNAGATSPLRSVRPVKTKPVAIATAANTAAAHRQQPQRGHHATAGAAAPAAPAVYNSAPVLVAGGASPTSGSSRNGSPACPGHFHSPQPHLLPSPTSSLLLRAATSTPGSGNSGKEILLAEVKLPRFSHGGEIRQFLASQTVPVAAA